MTSEPRAPRLAILINADHALSQIATRLFEEIARIGEASVRRIYGDFSGTRLRAWADVLSTHAIRAQQNFAFTTGKNASDIALVIDAMDRMMAGVAPARPFPRYTRWTARLLPRPGWGLCAAGAAPDC